jgi:Fe-S cluster biogenesis protein NfuA
MSSILDKLRNMFTGGDQPSEDKGAEIPQSSMRPPMDEIVATEEPPSTESSESEAFKEATPIKRTVVQPPIKVNQSESEVTDKILIKAEPTLAGDQCKFMVNRDLMKESSWYFENFESAEGSSIAEALFSVEGIESLLIQESTVTVTRVNKGPGDWLPMAKEIGSVIREKLEAKESLISVSILESIPSEEEVRTKIQEVIDKEVNPGVAGHGGNVLLTNVKGNTVTILMGGGCQGCSAADLTLKMGIHGAFRKALPSVGAILDETDHKAGLNPFYS